MPPRRTTWVWPAKADDARSDSATVNQRPDGYPNDTERARSGVLDPLIGRGLELQRTMEILCRRRKNNPVFVGDAGVGKTALAEGLAIRLLEEDVPQVLA